HHSSTGTPIDLINRKPVRNPSQGVESNWVDGILRSHGSDGLQIGQTAPLWEPRARSAFRCAHYFCVCGFRANRVKITQGGVIHDFLTGLIPTCSAAPGGAGSAPSRTFHAWN